MKTRMKYNWKNKEQLIEDLKVSTSMSNFLKRNNLKTDTSIFKQKIKDYNIDLKNIYLKKSYIPKTKIENNKFPENSEILCENSVYPRNFVHKYLKKNSLIPYVCNCGNTGLWQNKKLTLELEHKNGINNDNRLENLEYLCPNCHSQTKTYRAKNIHLKVFETRIKDLIKFKTITEDNIYQLAILWDIQIVSLKDWIITHEEKIKEYEVKVELVSRTFIKKEKVIKQIIEKAYGNNDSLEIVANNLKLSKEDTIKIIRVYNFDLYKKLKVENSIEENLSPDYLIKMKDLSKISVDKYTELISKWNMTEKEIVLWIKKNAYDYYLKILNYENIIEVTESNKEIIKKEINKINMDSAKSERISDVLKIFTKKEVSALSKKWNTSVNGSKKWIRNNLPDKFKEIYDDKHLIKNKNKVMQQERIKYLKSLTEEFSELEAMTFLNINKASLYAQIKAHNPNLLEKLHNKDLCPKCNYKTRSNGQYRRCLDCNHNFKQPPKIN